MTTTLAWALAHYHEHEHDALGWAVFQNSDHGLEIERDDELELFDSDAAAIQTLTDHAGAAHPPRCAVAALAVHYLNLLHRITPQEA